MGNIELQIAHERNKEVFSLLHCAACQFVVAYHKDWKPQFQVSSACGGCIGKDYCNQIKDIIQQFCNHGITGT